MVEKMKPYIYCIATSSKISVKH